MKLSDLDNMEIEDLLRIRFPDKFFKDFNNWCHDQPKVDGEGGYFHDLVVGSISGALKQIYGDYIPWYQVKGAKEELIRRIKEELTPLERVMIGIEEDL